MKPRSARSLPLARPNGSRDETLPIFQLDRIERRQLTAIKLRDRRTRTHSAKQIAQLTTAIQAFGEIVPLVIDEYDVLLDGYARYEVYQRLGMKDAAVIQISHLGPEEKRLFALSCNRLAEMAEWDETALRIEFEELLVLDPDIELELSAFQYAEVDQLLDNATSAVEEQETAPLPRRDMSPATRPGDLWLLDEHRLLCGNALEADAYDTLLRGEVAQMAVTDMPYNVPISGHVCGLGTVKHREFVMGAGEFTPREFTAFMHTALCLIAKNTIPAGIVYAFMDFRSIRELLEAGSEVPLEYKQLCIWVKTNAGLGGFYRNQHELVAVFKNGPGKHINNFGLGERRYRTNVWRAAGVNVFRAGRMKDLEAHPTVKPTVLFTDAMRDCSRRNGIILDPFAGSGTVFLAAERTGRVGRGIEIDPHYCDVAVQRWQAATGRKVIHAITGRTYDETLSGSQLLLSPPDPNAEG
jgi:DNA modification methylase